MSVVCRAARSRSAVAVCSASRMNQSNGLVQAEYGAMERRVYERSRDLLAGLNHTFAGAAGTGRTDDLAGVTAPTLVLHGTEDPMFPPAHAQATAAAIPGSRLVMLDGMGHTLPTVLDDRLADEILHHTRRGQGTST